MGWEPWNFSIEEYRLSKAKMIWFHRNYLSKLMYNLSFKAHMEWREFYLNLCLSNSFKKRWSCEQSKTSAWYSPGSLTHWNLPCSPVWKLPPFLRQNNPFFAIKHGPFSQKRPLFRDKTMTFQSKIKSLFCSKTLFSPNERPCSQ